ncbi:uncharacterized protein LOC144173481 [Haemaphysalis longicornis]
MKARIVDKVVYSPYPNIDIPVCSFHTLAEEKLRMQPDSLALVDDSISLTRGELLVQLKRYAVGFQRHGVRPGDRVMIHLANSVENLVAIYGCVMAGATAVMAKTSLTEYELRYQAEDSDILHILTEVEFTEKVAKATSSLEIKGLFSMGSTTSFVSAKAFSLLDERDFRACPVEDPKNTVMAIYYTSGSTGLPKGAEITHYSFVACFYTCCQHMPWQETEVSLSANPITHISGLVFQIMPVLNGASCAIAPAASTTLQIMDAIEKHKVTTMFTFPALLQAMVGEMRRTDRHLPTMRHIVTSGAVLTEWLSEVARSTFGDLHSLRNVYAMTEACILITAQPHNLDIAKLGKDVGLPAATASIKVVDMKTREKLGPYKMGEICFRAASMVRGYHKRPKESAELFDEDGWLQTGDAGYYDENGRLYFAERLKQMIKCMGNQVVPVELEELLLSRHAEEIAQVSVLGLPHAEYGEAAAAAVVLTEKGRQQQLSDLEQRIKATVAGLLAAYKHLYGGVFFLDSFPTTESSKVNRPALARLLA